LHRAIAGSSESLQSKADSSRASFSSAAVGDIVHGRASHGRASGTVIKQIRRYRSRLRLPALVRRLYLQFLGHAQWLVKAYLSAIQSGPDNH
jgi:hypothetical protein